MRRIISYETEVVVEKNPITEISEMIIAAARRRKGDMLVNLDSVLAEVDDEVGDIWKRHQSMQKDAE